MPQSPTRPRHLPRVLRLRRRTLLRACLAGAVASLQGSSPALGQTPPGRVRRMPLRALNLANGTYHGSVYPFANLLRTSARDWNPATWSDDRGWLAALPPGKETQCWVVLHLDSVHGVFMPGDYVLMSSSKATLSVVTLSRELISGTKDGVGRAAFSVGKRADGDYRKLSIGVRCRNDTSEPIDVTDLALHHVSHQAADFHPAWLATNRGASLVRTMDWAAINHSPVASTAQLPAASDRSWTRGVPYAVQARAAAALEADLWVCVPHGGQNHRYVCSAATGTFTAKGHKFSEGSAIVFVDYSQGRASLPEPLDYGTTYHATRCNGDDFQVAEAPGRPSIELRSDVGPANYSRVSSALGVDGLSQLFEAIAQQVGSGLGHGARVLVEYSNEAWNFSFVQAHFMRQYVSRLGASAGAPATGYAVGSLLAWQAFEKVLGRERVRRVFCAQSAWFENLAPSLDYVDAGLLAEGKPLARIADVYAIAPYVRPRNDRGRSFGLKDLLAAGAAHWSDTEWDAVFDRHIAALASGVAAHLEKARARNPALEFTSYECGQHLAEQIPKEASRPDVVALQRRYLRYLDGPAGAAMYRRYCESVFVRNGLRHFNHFMDAGGYASGSHLFQWGLKPSHLVEDNARGAFFKSLPSD